MLDFIYTLCLKARNETPDNVGVNFVRDYVVMNYLVYGWSINVLIYLVIENIREATIYAFLVFIVINVVKLIFGKFRVLQWLNNIDKSITTTWYYLIAVCGLVLNFVVFMFVMN